MAEGEKSGTPLATTSFAVNILQALLQNSQCSAQLYSIFVTKALKCLHLGQPAPIIWKCTCQVERWHNAATHSGIECHIIKLVCFQPQSRQYFAATLCYILYPSECGRKRQTSCKDRWCSSLLELPSSFATRLSYQWSLMECFGPASNSAAASTSCVWL